MRCVTLQTWRHATRRYRDNCPVLRVRISGQMHVLLLIQYRLNIVPFDMRKVT